MKTIYFLLLMAIITSCTLNSTQEKSLQNALNEYVKLHNEGKVTGFAALTHPSVLKYYNNLGENAFAQKFELVDTSYNSATWQNAIIRSTKKEKEKIHVLYRIKEIPSEKDLDPKHIHIVAISKDNGINWLFIDEQDYRNDKIFRKENRLL